MVKPRRRAATIPEGNKPKTLGAASAMIPHDTGVRALANVLKGLEQDRVCHIATQVAHKDVKMGGCVLCLLFLECPLDAHFLCRPLQMKEIEIKAVATAMAARPPYLIVLMNEE